jgi:site-specific recombinase XerD
MSQGISPRKTRRPNGTYWVVSLGRKYTGGLRQRRYFRSRKEASKFVTQSEEARHKLGHEAFVLPMTLRAETLVCSQRLKQFKVTLTQAVEFFIQNRPRPEAAKPLKDLKDDFLKSRLAMNCRPRTLVQYKSYLRVICEEFGEMETARIAREDIEDWFEEVDWSPRTRKNYLVTLTTLFNFAKGRGYRSDNPAAQIERPILDDRPVGILTIEQTKALLRTTKASDAEMVPVLAIGLFAGLRRSEFFALDWSEIDLEHRTIEVKGIKAKTRQRRIVHIGQNLFAWLSGHSKGQDPVTPERNIDVLSERLRELARKAGIKPWPHNAMRHSFGSHLLAKTKDENLTASEMGNSPGVVIRHYRAVVKDSDAEEYWCITPSTVGECLPRA